MTVLQLDKSLNFTSGMVQYPLRSKGTNIYILHFKLLTSSEGIQISHKKFNWIFLEFLILSRIFQIYIFPDPNHLGQYHGLGSVLG